jgi:hypothetical protein
MNGDQTQQDTQIASPEAADSSRPWAGRLPDLGDRRTAPRPPPGEELAAPDAQDIYRRVLRTLRDGGVEALVGGAYAFTRYTGIERSTKDFDVFVREREIGRALDVLAAAGFHTELTFAHWLGKAYWGDEFVDVIFNSGNGALPVDDSWFVNAPEADVLSVPSKLVPPEEMLCSKAFIMERERYDGADVVHLIRSGASTLNWERILTCFGERWHILLVNLILFGFVYPGERTRIPRTLMDDLLSRVRAEAEVPAQGKVCNGTLLSRQQYLVDVQEWGYEDARLPPRGTMTQDQIADWTAAIHSRP